MDLCRLCGIEKDNFISIFEKEHLNENILRCLHIQICEYDLLPHIICSACENEVRRIVRFIDESQKIQVEHHKRIFLERNRIPDRDIKLEDVSLDIEPPQEHYIIEEYGDVTSVGFRRNIPDLPACDNGDFNSSVVIKANHDQFMMLSAIGKDNLKQLGKMIYKQFYDEILKRSHLQLTFNEIQNDFDDLHKSLSNTTDPLLKLENPIDYSEEENNVLCPIQIPAILLTPSSETIIPDINQVESRSDLSSVSESSSGIDSKTVQCARCPYKTDRRFRLNQHVFEVHDKRFLCEPCGRRFGKKSKLLQHMNAFHTDLAPIVCSLCAMSFTQRFDYKKHLKTHSNGEGRSWRCDHCGDSFSLQHKLDIHVSRFHRSKSVKCSKCSYVASHKYQIKQHVREVHEKSIICDHCGKRESKKCRMVAHIQKKHMPKTEFVCEVCSARYSSKAWFVKHKREGCP